MSDQKHPVSVIILTKNEEVNIEACLDCLAFSDDVVVFDSYSDDRTVELAEKRDNVSIVKRKFDNWSAHQNWGSENIPFKHPWVLYLDADERIDESFADEIQRKSDPGSPNSAYRMRRKDMFMGRWLKHATLYPTWFVRLYRPEKIRFERLVNPIPVVDGPIGELEGHLIHYPFSKGTHHWFERHNNYSEFEAEELIKTLKEKRVPLRGVFSRDPNDRRNVYKDIFFRLPLRPHVKWLYYMLIRRAFLDGQAGMMYTRLTTIYEHMISIKKKEIEMKRAGKQV